MKRTTMGLLAVLLIGLVATSAFAFMGNEGIRNAFKSGDYNAYKQAHQNGLLSEEEFNARIQEREERRAAHEEKRAEMDAAIEQGYEAWKEAAEDCPLTDKITEENWDKFVELHQAKEKVRELSQELGFRGFVRGR